MWVVAFAACAAVPAARSATPPTAGSIGHCTAAETVVFSCDLRAGKTLSVCAGPGSALQYRFGKVGAPELVFPPTPDAHAFTLAHVTTVRAEGHVLQFVNAGTTYAVTAMSGGGCCSEGEAAANNFQGVYVKPPGGKQIAVACTGEPVDHLDALLATHTVPAPTE